MTPNELLTFLNSIGIGELDKIDARLAVAEEAAGSLDSGDEVQDRIASARKALKEADGRSFRKAMEGAVSRLGHLC